MAKRTKNIINNNKYFILTVYALVIFDLLLLYFIKYFNQKLSLAEFRFFHFGNFFIFLITFIILIGLTVIFIKKDPNTLKRKNPLLVFPLFISGLLIVSFILTKIPMSFGNAYFLQQPLNKFIIAMFFLLFQIAQIMYLSFIWLLIMGRYQLIYLRSLFDSIIIVVGFVAFGLFYSVFSMQSKNINSGIPSSADVAVVFGSAVWSDNKPSPSLSKRVEKAIDLYKAGVVEKIQLTGGNAPGELSEAEVGYNIVKKHHIDMRNVLIEKKTASSIEQVQYIKHELVEKEKMTRIIVISDRFHLNRINEICSFFNIKPQLVSSDLPLSWEKNIYYKIRESVGTIFFWLFAI